MQHGYKVRVITLEFRPYRQAIQIHYNRSVLINNSSLSSLNNSGLDINVRQSEKKYFVSKFKKFKSQKVFLLYNDKNIYSSRNGQVGYVSTFEKRGGQAWWAAMWQRIPRIHTWFSFSKIVLAVIKAVSGREGVTELKWLDEVGWGRSKGLVRGLLGGD